MSAAYVPRAIREAARPIRVALAEDDDDLRFVLADALVSEGFEVSFLPDGVALMDHLAHAEANDRKPDVLVLDHHMPGMEGLEVLRRLRNAGERLPAVFITGFGPEVRARTRTLDACTVFDKPLDLDRLLFAVRARAGNRLCIPWSASPATSDSLDPTCAACASTEYVRFDDTLSGVCFCADCWHRSEPPEPPYEDIGGSG